VTVLCRHVAARYSQRSDRDSFNTVGNFLLYFYTTTIYTFSILIGMGEFCDARVTLVERIYTQDCLEGDYPCSSSLGYT